MDRVLITGTSSGIGLATATYFAERCYEVHGFDIDESRLKHNGYIHHIVDVRDPETYPDIGEVKILINNAGVQLEDDAIDTNLLGLINITKRYGLHPGIKSIVNQASVSAHNGAEFPMYTASKGGVLSYTRWCAKEIAKYGATCNSVSFGGVITELNAIIMNDKESWEEIMEETPLKKWCTPFEAAEWIYFLAVTNRSMSGQDVIVDNLEMLNHNFVWKD